MTIDIEKTHYDISIPLRFGGAQPNVYGVDPAESKPCEYGDLVGDTRRGGSVNFEQYTFIPHCHGTHTECVGHITEERISVVECLKDVFSEALLITVQTENAIESGESYPHELGEKDEFVTCTGLRNAIADALKPHGPRTTDHEKITPEGVTLSLGPPDTDNEKITPQDVTLDDGSPLTAHRSLIVRTLPNDDSKRTRSYDQPVPPFFSNDAMKYIVDCGFKHLLVDLPSIDRLYDDGKLSNHRIFWKIEGGSKQVDGNTRSEATITELIYVPDKVKDGEYMLNLQIAPFETDAAPSRPLLFDVSNTEQADSKESI